MTPDELRALADEATPGPWEWHSYDDDDGPGELWTPAFDEWLEDISQRPVPDKVLWATGEHTRGYIVATSADARLIALAPALARLCAEFAELAREVDDPITNRGFDAALAKLSSLEPQ